MSPLDRAAAGEVARRATGDHERLARWCVFVAVIVVEVGLSLAVGRAHGAVWGWLVALALLWLPARALKARWLDQLDERRAKRSSKGKTEGLTLPTFESR